jgi:hypothetical protein
MMLTSDFGAAIVSGCPFGLLWHANQLLMRANPIVRPSARSCGARMQAEAQRYGSGCDARRLSTGRFYPRLRRTM